MKKCKHCGQPIQWDNYWTTWDHSNRQSPTRAELCDPDKGFEQSTYAEPEKP